MKHILVPIDFSHITGAVRDAVVPLAKAFDCKVTFLHVVPSMLEADSIKWNQLHEQQDKLANAFPPEYRKLWDMAEDLSTRACETDTLLMKGPAAEVILYEIQRLGIDYVIIGSHGHGAFYEMLVGSITDQVLRNSPCPVIVVSDRTRLVPAGEASNHQAAV
jgi:nucleotide-binding universal stress UspA family protein